MSDDSQADAAASGDRPAPRARPVLLYDGECPMCSIWARRCAEAASGALELAPLQEGASSFPQIPVEELRAAVHLVAPNGTVWRGARALVQAAAFSRRWRWLLWAHRRLPGLAALSEAAYRFLARHRRFFSERAARHPCAAPARRRPGQSAGMPK